MMYYGQEVSRVSNFDKSESRINPCASVLKISFEKKSMNLKNIPLNKVKV